MGSLNKLKQILFVIIKGKFFNHQNEDKPDYFFGDVVFEQFYLMFLFFLSLMTSHYFLYSLFDSCVKAATTTSWSSLQKWGSFSYLIFQQQKATPPIKFITDYILSMQNMLQVISLRQKLGCKFQNYELTSMMK